MLNNERSRLYINVVKGFAIFLMLWGHCIQYCSLNSFNFFENIVFKIIYTFHMPLFMIVSGYLFYFSFQKRELKELITHRAKPLLHTIVIGGILIYYLTTGLKGILSKKWHVLFNGAWLSSLSGIWFLWSVLVASLGVAIICKTIKRIYLQVILLFLWAFVIYLFPNASNNLYMYPYYVIGFFFAKYKSKIQKKLFLIKYISLLLFPIMLYAYVKGYTENFLKFKLDFFQYIIGLVGCVFALTILEIIFNLLYERKKSLLFPLSKVGQMSLQIYVLSIIFLSSWLPTIYSKIIEIFSLGNILAHNMLMYNFVYTFILSIAYTFILYFITKAIYKIRIGKMIFSR